MKKRLIWDKNRWGDDIKIVDRFTNVTKNLLKVTFHDEGLNSINDDESFALEILENIVDYKDSKLKIYSFDKEKPPSICFLKSLDEDNQLEFKLVPRERNSYFNYRVNNIDRIKQDANRIYYSNSYKDTNIERITQGIIAAQAHELINSNIFITKDIWLLENEIGLVNVIPPIEALKIITLFHRLNNIYLYPGLSKKIYSVDKSLFYWVLVNHNIEHLLFLNKFIGKNYDIEDELRWISLSIVNRCASCFETLDYISQNFYFYFEEESYTRLIYYFEYLMLLMVSAFELLLQVINKIFSLKINKYSLSFNPNSKRSYEPLINKLERSLEGINISNVLNVDKHESILKLLYIFRNNIHNPLYENQTKSDFNSDEKVRFIEFPFQKRGEEIIDLVNKISNMNEFGMVEYKYKRSINRGPLKNIHSLLTEPYSFANAITKYSIELLEKILSSMNFLWTEDFTKNEKKDKYSEEVNWYSDVARKYFRLIY